MNTQEELQFLCPQEFYLQVDSLPEVQFLCQQVTIPTVTGGETDMANRFNPGRIFITGDTLDYGTLEVTFLVDKDLTNYRSILTWLKHNEAPETQAQYGKNNESFANTMKTINLVACDASLTPLAEWVCYSAFPVSLDGFQYDATRQDVEYLTATASFRFHYFELRTYLNGAVQHNLTI